MAAATRGRLGGISNGLSRGGDFKVKGVGGIIRPEVETSRSRALAVSSSRRWRSGRSRFGEGMWAAELACRGVSY
jgi:hypothetical protein